VRWSAKAELGCGGEVVGGEVLGEESGPGCSGDHGGIVGREGEGWKGHGKLAAVCLSGEAATELGVGGDTAADENGAGVEVPGGGEGLLEEVADDGMLEAGEEVEGLGIEEAVGDEVRDGLGGGRERVCDRTALLDGGLHVVGLGVAEDAGFYAGEGEVEARVG